MRDTSKGLLWAALGLAICGGVSSQGALAYQVEGQPEKAFLIVDLATTVPVRVRDNLWDNTFVTPQEYLNDRCVGAKVSELNITRSDVSTSRSALQIVFIMPEGGCKRAQS
jgi:hypothetical protein